MDRRGRVEVARTEAGIAFDSGVKRLIADGTTVDRFLHRSAILSIKGETFRLRENRKTGLRGQKVGSISAKVDMGERAHLSDRKEHQRRLTDLPTQTCLPRLSERGPPLRIAQKGVLTPPDKPDQNLSDNRVADRAKPLTLAKNRSLGQDVRSKRRPIEELACFQSVLPLAALGVIPESTVISRNP
jgi:hypothetical protein